MIKKNIMVNARVTPEEFDILEKMRLAGGFGSMYELITGAVRLAIHEFERMESIRGIEMSEEPDEIEIMFRELTVSSEFIKPVKAKDNYFSDDTKARKEATQYAVKKR